MGSAAGLNRVGFGAIKIEMESQSPEAMPQFASDGKLRRGISESRLIMKIYLGTESLKRQV